MLECLKVHFLISVLNYFHIHRFKHVFYALVKIVQRHFFFVPVNRFWLRNKKNNLTTLIYLEAQFNMQGMQSRGKPHAFHISQFTRLLYSSYMRTAKAQCSDEPAQSRSLARDIAAHTHNVWKQVTVQA